MDAQRGIARRMVVGIPPEGITREWEKDFTAYTPAGVIVFRRDFVDLEYLRRLTTRLRALAGPRRVFIAVDEEGGFVSQLAGHLVVPPNAQLLGRGAQPGDIEYVSRVTGERLRALGIDWVFAPVADVHSEARNPVIGPRSFGANAATVSGRIAEVLRGFRAANVASCLKHFPGHGDTVLDSHFALPACNADRTTLDARELLPFRQNLSADTLMTAHVVYPALDAESPATFSRAITHRLLRDRLHYEGITVTDALEMEGAAAGREPAEAARLALEAGCDLLLFATHTPELRRARYQLARALVDGTIDRETYDAARPRLTRLDMERPSPTPEELARPLHALTPPEWSARLETIIERGLVTKGMPPTAQGPWWIEEPEFPHGPTMATLLAEYGVAPGVRGSASTHLVCVAQRTPLPAPEISRLREISRERPTVLVGLQNDGFLDEVPEAALTISAADCTPLTRRVVARVVAERVAV